MSQNKTLCSRTEKSIVRGKPAFDTTLIKRVKKGNYEIVLDLYGHRGRDHRRCSGTNLCGFIRRKPPLLFSQIETWHCIVDVNLFQTTKKHRTEYEQGRHFRIVLQRIIIRRNSIRSNQLASHKDIR